jgi:hypothetical protein
MKGVTFAVAFVLTACVVIGGTLVYPNYVGQAATSNNQYVFGLFLATFLSLLFVGWIGEKIVGMVRKPRKKKQFNEQR